MQRPSYIRPMQLFRAVSLVRSSRGTLSTFQFRLSGATPGLAAFGVGVAGLGAGELVPFDRTPLGVDVPLASFCSLTTCLHLLIISDANWPTCGSRLGTPFTLFTILPIPVALSSSSLGRTFAFRSRRIVRMFSDGSFPVMAFCKAEPLERTSRRSMLGEEEVGGVLAQRRRRSRQVQAVRDDS